MALIKDRVLRLAMLGLLGSSLASCSAVQGYPSNPEDTSAVLNSLRPYFTGGKIDEYTKASDVGTRTRLRDIIVLSRLRAYDIEFESFEKSLWGDGNAIALGSDLAALALGGIAATVKSAATKTAYAIAATGVIGAQAAINKDLFYQRTLPALLAQMEANRGKIKIAILMGLKQDDSRYPLIAAEIDLGMLSSAAGVPAGISNITEQASAQNQAVQNQLQALRNVAFSQTDSSKRIRAWLTQPDGNLNQAHFDSLQDWMAKDAGDPSLQGIPVEVFVDGNNTLLETDRLRAISALNIP